VQGIEAVLVHRQELHPISDTELLQKGGEELSWAAVADVMEADVEVEHLLAAEGRCVAAG